MRTSVFLLSIYLILGCNYCLAIAADQSSSNFQVEQTTTTVPLRAGESSTNFTVDSGVAAIVSSASSSSFILNSNETQPDGGTVAPPPTPPPPTPPPPSGGGGGSTVLTPTVGVVSLANDISCPIYKSSATLFGARDTNVELVEVNGVSVGVTYPAATSWEKKSQPFTIGKNTIDVNGKTDGARGPVQSKILSRNKPGDINGDGKVDDFDLSILASSWGKNSCRADFNKDALIDDFDLSILVSSWN